MEAIKVKSTKNNIKITIDKNIMDKDDIMSVINRLKIEKLIKEAEFDESILDIAEDIKFKIWDEVKKDVNFKNSFE